ncbi:MAG: hypothetical protein JNL67_19915 [Planctomycetaceae bacterium]|nr:hypothetical protein [Planctomycetaceae bacterium]
MIAESFLNWLVGRPESDGQVQLQWLNLPTSWGVFLALAILAAVVVFVFRLYQRENINGPSWMRPTLLMLRLLTLLFLFLLYLQPSISLINSVRLRPPIAIARDASASMAFQDRLTNTEQTERLAQLTGLPTSGMEQGEISRTELVNRLLGDGRNDWVKELRQKGAVRVVDFSTDMRSVTTLPALDQAAGDSVVPDEKPLATEDASAATTEEQGESPQSEEFTIRPLVADGVSTNLSRLLSGLISDDSSVGSIILLSDGQHNSSEDPVALAQRAARRDVPIYVIGVGDPARPRNVAVDEVYVRSKVRPAEPFTIEALVRGEDLGSESVTLQLIEQPLDPENQQPLGPPRELQSKPLQLPDGQGRIRINFEHSQAEPGVYGYRIVAAPIENESSSEDNSRISSPVEVIDDRVNVLLVSGGPHWDFQQVLWLLQRDASINVAGWLQSLDPERPQEGNTSLKTLPRTLEELGEYNVVILMDPDPSKDFDTAFMDALEQFLETKAGGLLYMAGPNYATEFLGRTTTGRINRFLPVQVGDAEQLDFETTIAATTELMEAGVLVAEPSGLEHPIMSFHSDRAKNAAQWAEMPNIYWTFPVATEKPATRVLLRKINPNDPSVNQPILVSGRYGAGTVLYFGFNSTWRWRSVGVQAQYYDRFWIQVIRYLVESRSLQGQRRALVETDRSEYDLGDRVRVLAKVLDNQFQPLTDEKIVAQVITAEEVTLPLELKKVPGQAGEFQGVFAPQSVGQFSLTIQLPDQTDDLVKLSDPLIQPASFRVRSPSLEANTYWLNESLLKQMAEISGGRYFTLDQWSEVAKIVPEKVSETQYESRPEPLWDQTQWLRWSFFVLPVLLLTLEWALRKRAKLL